MKPPYTLVRNLLFLLVFLPSIAIANPYLTSDPSPDGATVWQVDIDGTLSDIYPGDTVHYDLVSIPPGPHTIKARFAITWEGEGDSVYEWSEWSAPFPLTRPLPPVTPSGMGLKAQP